MIYDLDYFSSCIYTPQEYLRDLQEFDWGSRGKCISYSSIYSSFKELCQDQDKVLRSNRYFNILSVSLPRFYALKSVEISFSEYPKDQSLWFASRAFRDWNTSDFLHLDASLKAINIARTCGVHIEHIGVSGYYPCSPTLSVVNRSRSHVYWVRLLDIMLMDSVSLSEAMSEVHMSTPCHFEIKSRRIIGFIVLRKMTLHVEYAN